MRGPPPPRGRAIAYECFSFPSPLQATPKRSFSFAQASAGEGQDEGARIYAHKKSLYTLPPHPNPLPQGERELYVANKVSCAIALPIKGRGRGKNVSTSSQNALSAAAQLLDKFGQAGLAFAPQTLGGEDGAQLLVRHFGVFIDDDIIIFRPMAHFI